MMDNFYVDKGGKPRVWLYFVTFGVVECFLLFFGFKWGLNSYGFQRFFGWFLVFMGSFGFAFLFFGEFIMDQFNSVIYR